MDIHANSMMCTSFLDGSLHKVSNINFSSISWKFQKLLVHKRTTSSVLLHSIYISLINPFYTIGLFFCFFQGV